MFKEITEDDTDIIDNDVGDFWRWYLYKVQSERLL